MEEQVKRLSAKLWEQLQTKTGSERLLIAIAGIPGSGKTSLARSVARGVNDLHHALFHRTYPNSPAAASPSQPDIAIALPLDGFHLTRAQLSALPNADEAFFRRGAAFTFDGDAFLTLVERLRKPLEPASTTIYAPSFDHAVKDPVAHDLAIAPTARVVLLEGNYTALDRAPWRDAAALMDEIWFIDVPLDVAAARLVQRHVAAGISPDAEHARIRVEQSDMRNGRDIVAHRLPVQEMVRSVQDETWMPGSKEAVTAAALEPAAQPGTEDDDDDDDDDDDEDEEEKGDGEGRRQRRWRAQRTGSIAEMAEAGVGL